MKELDAYLDKKGDDIDFILIHRKPAQNLGVVAIWLVNQEDVIHTGLPFIWEDFEVFNKVNKHLIEAWARKLYKGRKASFHIMVLKPELLTGRLY